MNVLPSLGVNVQSWVPERQNVVPSGAASMIAALAAGEPVTLEDVDQFVDGAAVNRAGTLTYAALAAAGDMVSITTADEGAITPFWRAVFGVEGDAELPMLWFQQTESHQEPRQRFHLDITVPPEVAQQRIDAGLAAGGRLVSGDRAPAFTVLADADGNKVCICTSLGRD